MKSTDNLSVNTIRVLSAEAINKSNSGHPGITMGAVLDCSYLVLQTL